MAPRRREPLGMRHQPAAEAAALEGGRHRDVLDQQVIGPVDGLDQAGQLAAQTARGRCDARATASS